ncbi:hypothetical protein DLAC_05984 [Tieghemostelium lacteum]|uniref:Uncharacterized protein n=1 Tax=Tieghemostelium lacteum TaxID=361077 RepID=A0A151ZH75_TIELA|nr:hypothetical protein DLAC_05984 [Tieghemostelium lacteum]|eukprot:KYQ93316.1 hypothetical protein DLAC_05984 [Tieghemostelium lacteum]
MQNLCKGLVRSFSQLTINNSINNFSKLNQRNYVLVIDSIEIPQIVREAGHRPHRDQPTRARKRRVKREHQAKINRKRAQWQKNITDWRQVPPQHLAKFDPSKVKPKVDYIQKVDQFEDTPNGWKQRRHEKLLKLHAEEKQILNDIKQKRIQRHLERITLEHQRKEKFNQKMQARQSDSQQQTTTAAL